MSAIPPDACGMFKERLDELFTVFRGLVAENAELHSEVELLRGELRSKSQLRAMVQSSVEDAVNEPKSEQADVKGERVESTDKVFSDEAAPETSTALNANDFKQLDEDDIPGLWPLWQHVHSVPELSRSETNSPSQDRRFYLRGGDVLTDTSLCQCLILSPSSNRRMAWDLLSLGCLTFDVISCPLIVFDMPEPQGLRLVNFSITIFWVLDIVVNLVSGFHTMGLTEMRPAKVARRYLRKWFMADVIVVALDVTLQAMQAGIVDFVGFVRLGKIVRLSRLFRLLRLVRMMKMPAILEKLAEHVHSETVHTWIDIMKALAIIALVNHYIACGWYGVGSITDPSWVKVVDRRGSTFAYLTALHWSLTQFTPASMEVFPQNEYERGFSIIVLFSALVTFSSFISSITTAMTTLRAHTEEKQRQTTNMRKFMQENRISLNLGVSINAFLRQYNFMSKRHVQEDDVRIFKVLPESMRVQLHWETYEPILAPHPLFNHIGEANRLCILEICHCAMSETVLPISMELFSMGHEGTSMFFVKHGVVEYFHGISEEDHVEFSAGRWFCEPVLWARWEYHGRATALTQVGLVKLDANAFRKIVFRIGGVVHRSCSIYARSFMRTVLQADAVPIPGVACAPEAADVWCNFDLIQSMVHDAFDFVEHSDNCTRASFARSGHRHLCL